MYKDYSGKLWLIQQQIKRDILLECDVYKKMLIFVYKRNTRP